MASRFSGGWNAAERRSGMWNNRYKSLATSDRVIQYSEIIKHARRSTGGASTDLSDEQMRSIRLKGMCKDDNLDSIFECLQNIKFTNKE